MREYNLEEDNVSHTLERTDMVSIDIFNTWRERFILKETNQQECSM